MYFPILFKLSSNLGVFFSFVLIFEQHTETTPDPFISRLNQKNLVIEQKKFGFPENYDAVWHCVILTAPKRA